MPLLLEQQMTKFTGDALLRARREAGMNREDAARIADAAVARYSDGSRARTRRRCRRWHVSPTFYDCAVEDLFDADDPSDPTTLFLFEVKALSLFPEFTQRATEPHQGCYRQAPASARRSHYSSAHEQREGPSTSARPRTPPPSEFSSTILLAKSTAGQSHRRALLPPPTSRAAAEGPDRPGRAERSVPGRHPSRPS